MKILMFSSDPQNPRLRRYAEVLDKLEIIPFERGDGRFLRFWKGYRKAKKILKQEKFNLITAQDIEQAFIAWRLSRIYEISFEMQIHTDIFSQYFVRESFFNILRVWLAKFLIPKASCVRVVSERIKKSIGRDASILPIYSDPVKEGGRNIREQYPGYDFYILMVSRLSSEKNFHLALNVMREIIKTANALLVIVGDGVERGKIEHDILNGLETNVRLEGWQDNLSEYYASADVFLITSNYEGYNLSAVEALSNGLPVVMTDVGLAGEIVRDGENGLISLVGDKYGLSASLQKFFKDENLRLKLKGGALSTHQPYKSFEDYREKLTNSWKLCQK